MLLSAHDPRLAYFAPQSVDRALVEARGAVQLERFPRAVYAVVAGQLGPTANLRSSSGCAVVLRTDSPWLDLWIDQLRHHQPTPVGVALETELRDGDWLTSDSIDLRERSGRFTVRLATGRERGAGCSEIRVWMPLISTALVAGVGLADGAQVEPAVAPEPDTLVIGDSLAQGFVVQSPLQNWVHRLGRRRGRPAWNLGVGGLLIEPEVVAWALAARRWDLVVIALGSNHCWRDRDVETVEARATILAELALGGGHRRVVWCLPPWKPCEDGQGPPSFAGVPLDQATGVRVRRVRERLRQRLSSYAPGLEIADDLAVKNARLYPDGLHPTATGFHHYAEALAGFLERTRTV